MSTDREILAEVAVVAVREAQRTMPRQVWLPGVVQSVNVAVTPPEVGVSISGQPSVTYAQCLVSVPAVGERVLVVWASPAQAFTIPFAPSGP